LNEKAATAAAFKEEVAIPEGIDRVNSSVKPSNSAVMGMSAETTVGPSAISCHGFRFDVENGFLVVELLTSILDQVVQDTHQWWLRSPQSPFRGAGRLGASIGRDFRIVEELKFRDAGDVPSTCQGRFPKSPRLRKAGDTSNLANVLGQHPEWIACR
jgi:hypothetical protein